MRMWPRIHCSLTTMCRFVLTLSAGVSLITSSSKTVGMIWYVKPAQSTARNQTRSCARAEGPHDAPQIRNIALEKTCNEQITFKDTQGHYICCPIDRPCWWPVVATSLSSTVSEIVPLFQCTRLPMTFRSLLPLTIKFTSQAACALQL